ncbi:MAG: xanthine dehydrogenase small subunit [Rhodosalinus sp.]
MRTAFLLNGTPVETRTAPTETLLDWLRDARGLTGTKEGCNEGDCGACTVVVTDAEHGARALNACILFMPQLHGRAVRTVEGLGDAGAPHPAQDAMVAHHGSQCGFCTPGIMAAMAAAHAQGRTDHTDALAGNLCRCTGYAPILKAAQAIETAPRPAWVAADRAALDTHRSFLLPEIPSGGEAAQPPRGADSPPGPACILPESSDQLAAWYAAHPDATLIGGATDVGLWVTKDLRRLGPVAFLHRCRDLQKIEVGAREIRIGAAVTLDRVRALMAEHHPSFAELLRRFGSAQVRAAATLGGNIANGSPIGDSPPPLIALGAQLHLRHARTRRSLPLEDFFLDYGRQDRAPGEFVEAVTIPRQPDRLRVWKVSKRFDQDISAVCGAFDLTVEDGRIVAARIAFGGMAATPKRARAVEAALVGRPLTSEGVAAADAAWTEDFRPISDMRASADYRLQVARNLLIRYALDHAGALTSVLEVRP